MASVRPLGERIDLEKMGGCEREKDREKVGSIRRGWLFIERRWWMEVRYEQGHISRYY